MEHHRALLRLYESHVDARGDRTVAGLHDRKCVSSSKTETSRRVSLEDLLPRHLQIIYEINARHLDNIRQHFPNDNERIRRMSIIEEGPVRLINMAYLSIIGSHTVNGVAQIHSRLLRESMFKDFYDLTPSKFQNKTNGVTFRRWLALCNPELFALLVESIGEDFIRTDYHSLQKFRQFASNPQIIARLQQIKVKLFLERVFSPTDFSLRLDSAEEQNAFSSNVRGRVQRGNQRRIDVRHSNQTHSRVQTRSALFASR